MRAWLIIGIALSALAFLIVGTLLEMTMIGVGFQIAGITVMLYTLTGILIDMKIDEWAAKDAELAILEIGRDD